MGELQLAAWHGWGFPADCWKQWIPLLPEGIRFHASDRGYFGAASEPRREGGLPLVLAAHSFGLHLIPDAWMMQADLLVVCGGFRTFHPAAPEADRRSRRVLRRMISRFDEEPEAVLREFRRNCWHPESPPEIDTGGMDAGRLSADLAALDRAERSLESLRKGARICILHGTGDRIVPMTKGRELERHHPLNTRFEAVEGAPHALPFSHAERCMELLKPEFRELMNQTRS